MHTIGFELERVRIERNAADGGRAVELFAELLLGNVANQRRRREEAQQAKQYNEDQQTGNDTPGAA